MALAATAPAAHALSISVGTPPTAMTFSHSVAGSSTMDVTVVSLLAYTMKISAADGTPGRMDRVDCATRAPLGGTLTNALTWSSAAGGHSGTLSGTAQTVSSGLLLGSVDISFGQTLAAAESVSSGSCYQETVTVTVT